MSHAIDFAPRRRTPLSRRLLIPAVRLLGRVSPALASRAAERDVLIGAAADPTDFFRWTEANVARAASSPGHIPALFVHDRDDAEVPFSDAEEIVRSWPGARLHATAGLGHRRILSDPGVTTSLGRFMTERTGLEFHSEAESLEADLWDRRARWQPTPAL